VWLLEGTLQENALTIPEKDMCWEWIPEEDVISWGEIPKKNSYEFDGEFICRRPEMEWYCDTNWYTINFGSNKEMKMWIEKQQEIGHNEKKFGKHR